MPCGVPVADESREPANPRGSDAEFATDRRVDDGAHDEGALRDRLRAIGSDPAARPLLVALDLDGTLAPLRDDPMTSRVAPGGEAVLARLAAARGVHLALVSGRAMGQLPQLVDLPVGTLLVGSHGAERARVTATGLDREVVALSDEQADAIAALGGRAAAIARGRDGVWVETKPAAVVVHTRLAAPDVAEAATGEALALARAAGIRALHGKNVVELPVLEADKGAAIVALRAEVGAAATCYAGDDVTDEHAFAVLGPGDVGVKVGPGPTRAAYRVATPANLVAALAALAEWLRG
jgi:trehalose-phosphatase